MLAWYLGEQDEPGLPRGHTGEVYRRMRESSRNTWASLIVETIAERLQVQGYRSAAGDRELEQRAWGILQANAIDDEQSQVYLDALLCRVGYVMVTPPDPEDPDRTPVVTAESPLEVTHEWAPGGRRRVGYALKCYDVDDGLWRAELLAPDYSFVWTADLGAESQSTVFDADNVEWDAEPLIGENQLQAVPVVPFENRRTTSTPPLSEVERVEHVLQRIDDLLLGRQVSSHHASFRQKWATGLEVPRDPDTGEPIEAFEASVARVWISEDPDSRFGSFEATELGQYTKTISSEVAELAAISRVPSHYFVQQELANPPSADSLTAAESGLVAKVERRQTSWGESWEQVVRFALVLDGEQLDRVGTADEVVWRDAAVRSPAQVADAATKRKAVGVPDEALWEFLGASPQQIDRWRTMRAEQDLRAAELGLLAEPAPATE